jgi:hypothetical protein
LLVDTRVELTVRGTEDLVALRYDEVPALAGSSGSGWVATSARCDADPRIVVTKNKNAAGLMC